MSNKFRILIKIKIYCRVRVKMRHWRLSHFDFFIFLCSPLCGASVDQTLASLWRLLTKLAKDDIIYAYLNLSQKSTRAHVDFWLALFSILLKENATWGVCRVLIFLMKGKNNKQWYVHNAMSLFDLLFLI